MLRYQISAEEAKNIAMEIMANYTRTDPYLLTSSDAEKMLEDIYSTQNHKINFSREKN